MRSIYHTDESVFSLYICAWLCVCEFRFRLTTENEGLNNTRLDQEKKEEIIIKVFSVHCYLAEMSEPFVCFSLQYAFNIEILARVLMFCCCCCVVHIHNAPNTTQHSMTWNSFALMSFTFSIDFLLLDSYNCSHSSTGSHIQFITVYIIYK